MRERSRWAWSTWIKNCRCPIYSNVFCCDQYSTCVALDCLPAGKVVKVKLLLKDYRRVLKLPILFNPDLINEKGFKTTIFHKRSILLFPANYVVSNNNLFVLCSCSFVAILFFNNCLLCSWISCNNHTHSWSSYSVSSSGQRIM